MHFFFFLTMYGVQLCERLQTKNIVLPMFSNSSKHWNTILFCFNDRRSHISPPDIYYCICLCLQSLFLISLKPWAVKYRIKLLWTSTALQQGKTFNWIGEGKRKRRWLLKVGLFRLETFWMLQRNCQPSEIQL